MSETALLCLKVPRLRPLVLLIRITFGENRSTRKKKPVPMPLRLPQISHELVRDQTEASTMRGRRLTASAMARPGRKQWIGIRPVFKDSVRAWHSTQRPSTRKTNRLVRQQTVYCERHTEYASSIFDKKFSFSVLNVMLYTLTTRL